MDQSEILKFEQAYRQLTLSEALRVGARLRPQCKGELFTDKGSCALGAIYEAVFGYCADSPAVLIAKFVRHYPELDNSWCDIRERNVRFLISEIYTRNDSGQTREEIADWLESIGY